MFVELGYYKEYWIGNKFIGSLPCEKDREIIGYYGKMSEKLTNTITFKNKKQIKAGTEVTTVIYPLCGRISKP